MADKDRGESGQFTTEVTDAELLAGVRTHEPAATSEVASEVDMTRQGVDQRLRRLRDDGRVSSKKIGASLVWFAPVVQESTTGGEQESAEGSAPPEEHTPQETTDDPTDDALGAIVERVGESWEDSPDRLAARKRAALAVLQYARDQGGVSKQEAKEEIYAENPVDGQNARTWYRKNIRPVLNEAAEYDRGTKEYQITLPET